MRSLSRLCLAAPVVLAVPKPLGGAAIGAIRGHGGDVGAGLANVLGALGPVARFGRREDVKTVFAERPASVEADAAGFRGGAGPWPGTVGAAALCFQGCAIAHGCVCVEVAAPRGVEPRYAASKAAVLPLNERALVVIGAGCGPGPVSHSPGSVRNQERTGHAAAPPRQWCHCR